MKNIHNQDKALKKTIYSCWSWIGLGCLFLPAVGIYCGCELLPPKSFGDFFWIIVCLCAIIAGLLVTNSQFYRFKIDSSGITMQRLLFSRFFPWTDIKEIILSSRGSIGRFVRTAIICKEIRRPFIRLDVGSLRSWPKWCMCIDLDSREIPADKGMAYVDQEQFLQFIKVYGIDIQYDRREGDGLMRK